MIKIALPNGKNIEFNKIAQDVKKKSFGDPVTYGVITSGLVGGAMGAIRPKIKRDIYAKNIGLVAASLKPGESAKAKMAERLKYIRPFNGVLEPRLLSALKGTGRGLLYGAALASLVGLLSSNKGYSTEKELERERKLEEMGVEL